MVQWFPECEYMNTTHSISYLCNNLTQYGQTMAYASIEDAIHVDTTATPYIVHKIPIVKKSVVHQVRLCSVQNVLLLVIATELGVYIFDSKGATQLFEVPINEVLNDQDDRQTFCRGICAIPSNPSYIIVGTSQGCLLQIGVDTDSKAVSTPIFTLNLKIPGHRDSIQCADSSNCGRFLASSDNSGIVLVRNASNRMEIIQRMNDGVDYPVTTLRFTPAGWLITGYLTGRISIYTNNIFTKYVDIDAHSRAITALDVSNNYIVSVGEDTFMNVWEMINHSTTPRIKLVNSLSVANNLLTGVAFTNDKHITTAAYDTTHLKQWQKDG